MQRNNGLKLSESVLIDRGDGSVVMPGNPLPVSVDTSAGPVQVIRQPTATAFLTQIGVNQNSSGDVTIIPSVSGKVIRVYRVFLMAAVAGNLTPKDGTNALCGPLPFAANGGIIMDFDGEPWFTLTAGNAFVINLSVSGQLSGRVGYTVT